MYNTYISVCSRKHETFYFRYRLSTLHVSKMYSSFRKWKYVISSRLLKLGELVTTSLRESAAARGGPAGALAARAVAIA